jgi:hypothetical protein
VFSTQEAAASGRFGRCRWSTAIDRSRFHRCHRWVIGFGCATVGFRGHPRSGARGSPPVWLAALATPKQHARKVCMRLVSADKSTGQFRNPPQDGDGSTTSLLIRPVFTRGGDKRRRFLVRAGYLAAASCVAYLAMVLVSVTASPAARPTASAGQAAGATTVRQVTPARPSAQPSAPAAVAPLPSPRAKPPVVAPAPALPSATPVAVTPTLAPSTGPTAAATKTKRTKSGSASASKISAPPKTTAAAAQPGGA